ncbi:MAG TPA: carboxypeptidase regulatory-like domain-containing protein [Acidobacteriaceae bacterium]
MRAWRAYLILCLTLASPLAAQTSTPAMLAGSVLDPSGAAIPAATLHLHGKAGDLETRTDALGHYTLAVPPGTYELTAFAKGFRTRLRAGLVVPTSHNAALNITLEIATASEEINVSSDGNASTDSDSNKSALVFKNEQLDTFSDDPASMQQQLSALAGTDPTNPPQIYVDGFSNGTMPPKESIREIRINQNPFSAVYDQFGGGRIEIFTKPGANQLHGGLETNFGTSALNARNPYANAPPAYVNDYSSANINGPLGKKSSFYVSVNRSDLSQNGIIKATTLDPSSLKDLSVSQAVSNEVVSQSYSVRIDRQFGASNTFIGRYSINLNSLPNGGVGQFSLPNTAYASNTRTQALRLTDTHLFGPNVILDSGLQYLRTRQKQDPQSTFPSIVVQGAFTTGGYSGQSLHDNLDRLELQEYFSISHKTHFVRTGLRYRMLRDANLATASYNGQFVFSSLPAFRITLKGLLAHESDSQIRKDCETESDGTQVCGGGASQFSLTAGTPSAALTTGDIGVYAEDEWKLRPDLTLNYGVRFESQSAIPDHFDVAPRVGFAYSIKRGKAKDPFAVVRGGFGLFYQRFDSASILQSIRQNGTTQQAYVIDKPEYMCDVVATPVCVNPTIPSLSSLSGTPLTTYRINPDLRSPMQIQGLMTLEHSFGKHGNMAVNYFQRRTIHQFESLNINAPMPGAGINPLGGPQAVYEYSSDGISNGHTLSANANLNVNKFLSAWVFANFGHQETDTFGTNSFPTNSYNVRQDVGVPTGYSPRQLYSGINAHPGWDTSLNVFLAARSSGYFNITTGQDNNGDSVYNDRPAFATDLTRASVVRTAYGNFDTNPLPGQTIIPFDYGRTDGLVYMEVYFNKNFRFGPRPSVPAPPASHDAPATGRKAELPPQRYRLQVGIGADNLFNHVNPGAPIGVLSSPQFGQIVSMNAPFSQNSAANRAITLRGAFFF